MQSSKILVTLELDQSNIVTFYKNLISKKFQLTWADIALAAMLDRIVIYRPEALEQFSSLKEHMTRINESENIKNWMEKRPKTQAFEDEV